MERLGSDILSRYPTLSGRLRNVSKQFESESLRGACDKIVTNDEIINKIIPNLENYGYGLRFYADLESNQDFDRLQATIFSKVPFTNNCVVFFLDSFIDYLDKSASFGPAYYEGESLVSTRTIQERATTSVESGNKVYFDLLTIRDHYKSRINCVIGIENYVRGKIFDYFDDIVKTFNTNKGKICLNYCFKHICHKYKILNIFKTSGLNYYCHNFYQNNKIIKKCE